MTIAERVSLTLAECAKATGLSEDYIRRAYRSGAFPVRYAGSKILVRRDDLEQWIDSLPTERSA